MKEPNIMEECPGSCVNFYADLVFVIDSSDSIKDANVENWNITLTFVNSLVETLDIAHDKLDCIVFVFF